MLTSKMRPILIRLTRATWSGANKLASPPSIAPRSRSNANCMSSSTGMTFEVDSRASCGTTGLVASSGSLWIGTGRKVWRLTLLRKPVRATNTSNGTILRSAQFIVKAIGQGTHVVVRFCTAALGCLRRLGCRAAEQSAVPK